MARHRRRWPGSGPTAAGLRTAYLERPGGDPTAAGDRFDLHLGALAELT
ncbi:hypothetical protein [Actinomycetospora sp. NBRC 106375]|nr:hypothetical protein [Actinomycetospora sp. NBRC 106375]